MERVRSQSFRLAFGGLTFVLTSDEKPIVFNGYQPYRDFILQPDVPDEGEIVKVPVSIGTIGPSHGKLLFDTGSWALCADGDERSLVLRAPGTMVPVSELRFNPAARDVRLTCSPELLETGSGLSGVRCPFSYPLDQVLAMYFLGEKGLIVHAAGMVRRDRALVFAGVSGAGKSTVSRLASVRGDLQPLSDDRVILRVEGDRVVAHGTPWPGESGQARRLSSRANILFFLDKSTCSAVRPADFSETLARLLPTVSLPWYDPPHLEAGLRACDAVIRRLPAAVFTFPPDGRALDALDGFFTSRETSADTFSLV